MTFVRAHGVVRARLSSWRIPNGDAGVNRTVEHMRALARERSPLLAEVAAGIVWEAGQDPDATAAGIRDFVGAAIRYVPDAWNAEVVRSPTYLLRRIQEQGFAYGDCDDMATLAAGLALAAGLPARFVLIGFHGGPWEHVYAQIWTAAGWLEVDPSRPEGLELGASDRIKTVTV